MNEDGLPGEEKWVGRPDLSIIELLDRPPSLSHNFTAYIEMIESSMSLENLSKQSDRAKESRLSLGMKALSASVRNITDPFLLKMVFQSIAKKSLINLSKLDQLLQLGFGVEPFLFTAIKALNLEAVKILIELKNSNDLTTDQIEKSTKKSDLIKNFSMAFEVFGNSISTEDQDKSKNIIYLIFKNLSDYDLNEIKSDKSEYFFFIIGTKNKEKSDFDINAQKNQYDKLADPHDLISLLIKLGVNPNIAKIDSSISGLSSTSGNYPLHLAAALGYWESVIILINGGSELEAKNKDGITAFEYAEKTGTVGHEMRAVFRSAKMRNIVLQKNY